MPPFPQTPRSPNPGAGTPTLLGLPFDAKSSFERGAAGGPAAIRAALASSASNSWSESGLDMALAHHLGDAGDVIIDPANFVGDIEGAVGRLISERRRVIALGGDHSVTYPAVRAHASHYPELTILHLDAHSDLYPEYDGDPLSHACPFARIAEERLASHIVQVGVRTLNDVQRRQASRFGVEIIDMREWAAGERPVVHGSVYLSLDLDVFDPGFAPGVSHRESGGLSPREVLMLVQSLGGRLIGADVVELNPLRDPIGITAPLAAKLVKEIGAKMQL